MDKQLETIDAAAASEKASSGKALTLRELAVVTGLGYSAVRQLSRRPGFPLLAGRVWHRDFELWRHSILGIGAPNTAERRRPSIAGRFER
jgi:hypothetical protein